MLEATETSVAENSGEKIASSEELGELGKESKQQGPDYVATSDSDAYDTDLDVEDDVPRKYSCVTAEDIYLRACEQHGVVPASYFLANMRKPSLDISHHGLGPQGAKAISPPLVVNTTLIDLNIEDNWVTAEGAKHVADMLVENCYISTLNMAENQLRSKGAQYICEMLMENTTLRNVNLSANGFKDNDAMYFADVFRANFKLKEFNLNTNAFCEIGGEWLGQGIAANESIEYLNLSWNHLRLKGALAICAGMKINITLRQLDLSWNGFANEGAAAMAEALKTNNTLTWLDMSHNRITGEGAKFLAKALLTNDTLRTLKIGENPLDAGSAFALLKAIADNERSAMEDLDLTGVTVGEDFKALALEMAQRSRASSSRTSFHYNISRTEDMRTDFGLCGFDADPMDVLQEFLEKKRLRLVDLFRNFDKDLSWKISPVEFKNGIANAGIKMSKQQLRKLMSTLEYDVEGQIDYREFNSGKKKAMLRRREERRRRAWEENLKRAEQDRFLGAWNEAIKKAGSPSPSPRGSPATSPRGSRPSSARGSRPSSACSNRAETPTFIMGNTLAAEPITAMEKYQPMKPRAKGAAEEKSFSRVRDSPRRPRERTLLESSKRMSVPSLTIPVKYKLTPALKNAQA